MNLSNQKSRLNASRVFLSIVSHNDTKNLLLLVQDLLNHAGYVAGSTIVTHNIPCSDSTRATISRLMQVTNPRPLGFAENHNQAFNLLQASHGPFNDDDWFVVVNPDIRFSSDPFAKICEQEWGRVGIVAPRVLDQLGRPTDSARDLPSLLDIFKGIIRIRKESSRPKWFAGMFLAIRVDCWRSVGGFCEAFFMYCEDADLCFRAQENGWDLGHLQDVFVVHEGRRSSHRSLRHFLWHVNSLKTLWRTSGYKFMKGYRI
jgi:GT2 family glycosyltransferase